MTNPVLLRLPTELLLEIISNLEFHNKAKFAATCHSIRSLIEPLTHHDFLIAEKANWATSRGLYTCKLCIRLRRFNAFADDMKKGKYDRDGKKADTRFCLECGVENALYKPGTLLKIYGKSHVLCRICRRLTDQIGLSKNACIVCSPIPRVRSPYEHDFATNRSTRTFYGRLQSEELWPYT